MSVIVVIEPSSLFQVCVDVCEVLCGVKAWRPGGAKGIYLVQVVTSIYFMLKAGVRALSGCGICFARRALGLLCFMCVCSFVVGKVRSSIRRPKSLAVRLPSKWELLAIRDGFCSLASWRYSGASLFGGTVSLLDSCPLCSGTDFSVLQPQNQQL